MTDCKAVAEHYAKLLYSLDIIRRDNYNECSHRQSSLNSAFSSACEAGGGVVVLLEGEDAERDLSIPSASRNIPFPSSIPVIFTGRPGLKSILADPSPSGDLFGNTQMPVLEITESTAHLVTPFCLLNRFDAIGANRILFEGGSDSIIQLQRSMLGTGPEGIVTQADIDRAFFHIMNRYEIRLANSNQPRLSSDVLHIIADDMSIQHPILTPLCTNSDPTESEKQWLLTKNSSDIVNEHMKNLLAAENMTTESKDVLLDIFSTILSRRQSAIEVPACAYNLALVFDTNVDGDQYKQGSPEFYLLNFD